MDTLYVIASIWAWRTPSGSGLDITHRAARVTIYDLLLGEGSERGAFIDRLTHVSILGNYTFENQ